MPLDLFIKRHYVNSRPFDVIKSLLQKVGNTSMTFRLTAWAQPYKADSVYLIITDALFTYVSIDEKGRPVLVKDGREAETAACGDDEAEGS